jgi:hypothetical protein
MTLHVDSTGSDANAGTIEHPFKSVQHAVDAASERYISTGITHHIVVADGHYWEDVDITTGVYITGLQCTLTGTVTVRVNRAYTDVTTEEAVVCLSDMTLTGQVLDTSTTVHTLWLENMSIYTEEHGVYQSSDSSSGCHTHMTAVSVEGTNGAATLPLVEVAHGSVYIERCEFRARGPQNVFAMTGTSADLRATLSIFESTSDGSDIPAVVHMASASHPEVECFMYSTFVYTSGTAKRAATATAGNNTGVWIAGGRGASPRPSIVMFIANCYFILTGTEVGAAAVKEATPNHSVVMFTGNSCPAGNASVIDVGVKMAYVPVM